ncbi:glycosyltransferase [Candidatus Electronema sp. PJ]|uniref:glycosyltransferase n=1 Tax=Candidatus Electronema sp. PJ TaxID=3401572 RepID=UPI003AA8DBE8
MKLLLLAPQPFFQNRGTPIAVRLLAETLGKMDHEVHLLVFHEGEDLCMGNVTVHRTAALPFLRAIPPGFSWQKICCDLLMTVKAIQLHRQVGFDLVHAVEESVFIAMLLRLLFKVPYIYDLDSWMSDQLLAKFTFLRPFRGILESFEKAAVQASIGVVPVCRAIEDNIRSFNREKPLLRLEDISLLEEDNGRLQEPLREKFGCQGQIVMYVGNLERYQGMALLLEAFALADPAALNCSLIVIGGTEKDIDYYTDMARQLNLARRVFFIGPRPATDLGMYLKQADVLVSPRTEGENTPMKIYSYMDSGKPILATKIVSHTQVLDEDCAFLAAPEPSALAAELQRIFSDSNEADRRAKQAKEKATEYSRPAYERKIMKFYQLMQQAISA